MTKNFAIFKAKEKKNENSPDYTISIKVGEKYETVGGCWIKEGKGGKFFSCKLSDAYGERKGYAIKSDELTEEEKAKIAALRAGEATKVEVDASSIPF